MIRPSLMATLSLNTASLQSIDRHQRLLSKAQIELSTGRHDDLGIHLGARTGSSVMMRNEQAHLQAIVDANAIVRARIDVSQSSLASVASAAQEFFGLLASAGDSQVSPTVLRQQAAAGLSGIIDALNVSVDGVHLFGGINTDVAPVLDDFSTPTSLARQASDSAFYATFGMTPTDPALAFVSASSMQAFLDTTHDSLFALPAWQASWSRASDQVIRSRISARELVETSTTVNAPAVRQVVQAFAMIAQMGIEHMSPGTTNVVVQKARDLVAAALPGLTGLQSSLGSASAAIKGADERMGAQVNLMAGFINEQEGVDSAEIAERIARLTQGLEAAYAITARLHRLSLLNEI